jgi:hypothetical protein
VSNQLIVVSEQQEDLAFGELVAMGNGLEFRPAAGKAEARAAILARPNSLVFWDVDDPVFGSSINEVLRGMVAPSRAFALMSQNVSHYPQLFRSSTAFCHHVLRRYSDPAASLYSKLIASTSAASPYGLVRYFPDGCLTNRVRMTRSGQKRAVVDAVQGFMEKQGVISRMSALVAQAADELIMNAIFDAPVMPNGTPFRRGLDRNADFELAERERVEIEVAACEQYFGLAVADHFGSLRKSAVLSFIARDYQENQYVVRRNDVGAGLGLHVINQSGLSLLFTCKPGVRTEAMVFFKRCPSYKEFRTGFSFLSVLAD